MNLKLRRRYMPTENVIRGRRPRRLVDALSHSQESSANQATFGLSELFYFDLRKTIFAPLIKRESPITPALPESNAETKQIQRNVGIMSVGLMAAIGGAVMTVPALILFSAVCQLYCLTSYYEAAYKALVQERRLTVNVLDSIILSGALLGGFVVTAAIANWFVAITRLMMTNTEDHSMLRLIQLFGDQPRHVWILHDDLEIEIPFEKIKPDDIVVVNAGQMIPIDGRLIAGGGLVDQHRLTGESQPAEKSAGDSVFAATVVLSGKIFIQVEKAGTETLAAQIGSTLNQTTDYRMNIQSDAIAFVDKLTPPTLLLSGLALPFAGISGALAVLWNIPGYRMMFFGPLNMLTYLHVAVQNGVLIKDGRSLDLLRDVDTIVFDKTGTLTLEQPHLAEIYLFNGMERDALLRYVASAEQHQTHPIAKAILEAAHQQGLSLFGVDDAHYTLGNGIKADFAGKLVHVGSRHFMQSEGIAIPEDAANVEAVAHEQGFTVVMVSIDGQLVGLLELRSTIRPEAKGTLTALRELGMDLYIISGDYEAPTRVLADELGISNYFSQVLPADKAALVETLQKEGRSVCFVGDGINDSIALKQANVSVSIAGATAIATDTAHIILMQGELTQLVEIFAVVEKYANDLRTYYRASIIPGVVCTVGTFLFGWGFLMAVIFAQGSNILALGKVIRVMRENGQPTE
ncbi:MAG: heavy metal translocating P-type ATPase [Chloroflexota bacterium]